jgi:putative nucleotidyltransferase with HDIG domain
MPLPDQGREEETAGSRRKPRLLIYSFALATALILAFVLLPRIPQLKKGDIATKDIVAPTALYVEYQGPDQTTLFTRVSRGEVIVEAGRRVSEKAEAIIAEMAKREGIGDRVYAYVGLTILILLVFYLFYRDVKRYRPALTADGRKIILLAFLLLVTVIVAQFSRTIMLLIADAFALDAATVGFALPVAFGAMLVSLLLDFHLALAFSFIVSLLLGMLFPGDPFMPLYYFTTSIMAALHVIRCKKRTAVIRAGGMTALVSFVAIIGIDLYHGELFARGLFDLAAGLVGAAITATLVSVTLPFFEAVFDIATDIKLLELMDPNQPLLKEMVYKSPGTYHHSIVIGNLAEAAAEAINENALLARVGAYYHDIGKAQKPEYFIENQRSNENKHDNLSPSMSSLIITSHVKEGAEMARQQSLPSVIVDIIRQHHGTSLISFFYQKAKELQPLAVLAEQDFRYPGPRPRTKIAAIVMLADAVEAASRTLGDPSPQRIQGLTNSVITRIFLDDQLSMCDLTLKDLREIAKSFNMVLAGIYHHRIDYPGIDFGGTKKRGDHSDKKHVEEAKAASCGHKG